MYKKIIIMGEAGRGKTTLADNLSKILELFHYSTDDFFYIKKFTEPRPREEALNQISSIYTGERWIVEGTTQWLLAPGLEKADLIIFLVFPNIFTQWWSIIKRGVQRKDSWKGTLLLLKHVFLKRYGLGYKKGKTTNEEFLLPYKQKVIKLKSHKEIDNFVSSV